MKSIFFAASAACLGATAVLAQGTGSTTSQAKANPPNHAQPGPEYYIYQDIDYISTPSGNTSACLNVQSIRSKCYSLGVKSKNLTAEQECLCTPDSAYAVTQCFARNYQNIADRSAKANYYQDFLDYTYDCYCGITGYDVTYNRTVQPPKAFISGFTGDAMLPPQGGCPAKVQPKVPPQPAPPCGCAPPPHPPSPPCPDGYHRVNKCCVPDPPPCDPCQLPKVLDDQGKCNCPWYLEPVGNTCRYPPCPGYPLEVFVQGCYGGYCECIAGYEYNSNGQCVQICGWGEVSDGNGGCTPCQEPLIPDYNGQCICPTFYGYTEVDGQCILGCPTNELYSYGHGGCYCPEGYYYNTDGDCVQQLCTDWTPQCYPGYPGIDNDTNIIVSFSSSAPPFSSYVPTTTYNESLYTVTETVAPLTDAPPLLIPTTTAVIDTTVPANSTGAGPTDNGVTSTDDSSTTDAGSVTDTATDSSSTAEPTSSPSEPTSDSGSGGGGGDTSTDNGGGGDGGSTATPDSGSGGGGGGSDSGSGGGGDGSGGGDGGATPTARIRARGAVRQVGRWL